MGNCSNNCNPCQTSCDNIDQLANKAANYARQAATSAVNAENAATAPAGGDLTGNYPNPQIASGVIVDGDISATAGIADTKLATISTAGKVANSATTATSANTANAIVARDANGDFTANAITGNSDATINQLNVGRGSGNEISNTAVGYTALEFNTIGTDNTAIGRDALKSNLTGNSNTAVGALSLQDNVTGQLNTAIGKYALRFNDLGSYNTAIGYYALATNHEGEYNTAVGYTALDSVVDGLRNTAIGSGALNAFDGSESTAVGYAALSANFSHNNTSGLGNGAQVTGANQVQLGDSLTTTYVYGTVQNRSDLRDKTDIRDTRLGLEFIKALRPVDYRWDMREDYRPEAPDRPSDDSTDEEKAAYEAAKAKWFEDVKLENITHDGSKKRSRYHHGLIAQEVKAVLDAKKIDFGGFQDHKIAGGDDVLSIGYDELIAPMIKAIQELSAEVTLLKSKINQ